MKRISPETENKLMTVIETTSSLVNDGMSPNDAIVKAASDAKLRPGDVSLVVHAYNTGRTGRQRLDGHDPFEKAAQFELADTAVVLEQLYPTTVKTAAAVERDTAVSTDYGYGPGPMLERRARTKVASNIDWRNMHGAKIETPAPLPVDEGYRYKKAMADVQRAKDAADIARAKEASAFDQLGRTFNELTTYFRRPDALPMPVVKEAAILLHGGVGQQLIDQIATVTPALTKLANHRTGQSLLGVTGRSQFNVTAADLDCEQAPFPLIGQFVGELHTHLEKKAEHAAAVAAYTTCVETQLGPFVVPSVSPSLLGPSSDERAKLAMASPFDITDPLKMLGTYSLLQRSAGAMGEKLKGPDDNAKLNKVVSQLNDPEHESRLREINTQSMLQDLMLNDDVISGYHPDEVTGAFNDITQISPSVADQKMLMQSLLRKRLQQGQLDTFEQDQLLGFEDKLLRQVRPTKTPGKVDGSII